MFRTHKRKTRPISTPVKHTFFASDLPDNCENGITAFAAKFDVSLDETDVYGNLKFKSFLEDAAPIKIGDMTSQTESWTTLESENGNTENLVQTNISAQQDVANGSDLHTHLQNNYVPNCDEKIKDAGLEWKQSMDSSGERTGKNSTEDNEEDFFLCGSSASLAGYSQQKRKGRAPPPPKRLSSLHPLDEDMCQDSGCGIMAGDSCAPLESLDSKNDPCERSSDHLDGYRTGLTVTHQALVAELTRQQKTIGDSFDVVDQPGDVAVKAGKSHQLEQNTSGTGGEWFSHVHLRKSCTKKTSNQNTSDRGSDAKSDVSRTVCVENPANDIIHSGKVSMATRPLDIAIGSSLVIKPKVTVNKPKIPVKPVHLKSPVAAGLPDTLFVKEATSDGPVSKIVTPEKGLLLAKACTRGDESNLEKRQQIISSDDQSMCQRTLETEAKSNGPVPKIITPEKKLANKYTHKKNAEETQQIMHSGDRNTCQRTEAGVKIGATKIAEIGSTKCDSDNSSEGSVRVVMARMEDQLLASTPIPPPRRKKFRNRDRVKAGWSGDHLDTVSASSSMSSEHSVGQGTISSTWIETTSSTSGQCSSAGGKDVNTVSHSPSLPSPIRTSSQTVEQENNCGTFESFPPPPKFYNPDFPLTETLGTDCLDLPSPLYSPSNKDQQNNSEGLVVLEDSYDLRSTKEETAKVSTSSGEFHQALVSCETSLQDRVPNTSVGSCDSDVQPTSSYLDNSRVIKENPPCKPSLLNILVQDDYLPQCNADQVHEGPEVFLPQPWEVSMAMSAHLMDLATRPWDHTVVPPLGKGSGGTRPTIVDHVWQMKPVELWDTSDVCGWCKTALEFDALANVFQECAIDGVQLQLLTAQDLGDLGITDALDKNTILDEIIRLQRRQRDSAPFWNLKQISFRRNTLELSNDILKRRLGHLQELNDKQDVQISEYITELQDEQRRTHQLINRVGSEPVSAQVTSLPTPLSSTMRCHMSGHNEMPLMTWTNRDVLKWLRHVSLSKFIGTFAEHKITGSDLAGISMHLLDKMDIMTTEDRELILAELYKLQHPAGPSLEQVIHEQRSYCSDYSEHSSGTPREELTEPVGLPAVRRQPCDTDTTEVVLQLDVENKSSMEDRQTRQSDKTSTQDPLHGNHQNRPGSRERSVASPLWRPSQCDSFNSGQSNSDHSHTANSGDNLELLQELALLRESIRERDDVISQLRRGNTGSCSDTDQENSNLSEALFGHGPQCVECYTIQAVPSGDVGFMVGRDSDDRLIVKHVADGQPLRRGDRLIEVNGRNVYRLQEREVIHILQKAKDTLVVVVLRDLDSVPMKEDEIKTEELESLRDNLSLAMLEVETTQQENKDLNGEMERLKQSKVELVEDNEALRNKITDLERQLADSETSRRGLYTILERIGNSASAHTREHEIEDAAQRLQNGQTRVQVTQKNQQNGHITDSRCNDIQNGLTSGDKEVDLNNDADSTST